MHDADDGQRLELKGDVPHREPAQFILKPDGHLHARIDGVEWTCSPVEVEQLHRFLEKEPSQIAEDSELVRFAVQNRLSFATSTYGARFDNPETGASLRIRQGLDESRARTSLSGWIDAGC